MRASQGSLASARFKPKIEPLNPRNPQRQGKPGVDGECRGKKETQWLFAPFVHCRLAPREAVLMEHGRLVARSNDHLASSCARRCAKPSRPGVPACFLQSNTCTAFCMTSTSTREPGGIKSRWCHPSARRQRSGNVWDRSVCGERAASRQFLRIQSEQAGKNHR